MDIAANMKLNEFRKLAVNTNIFFDTGESQTRIFSNLSLNVLFYLL